MSGERVVPKPTPETQHYWDGAREGELRLQNCDACDNTYFPPRPFCPECGSREVSVIKASGRGKLHSYIINHLPSPGFNDGPFAIAVVELEEGPRLTTNIVNCGVDEVLVDMPVKATYDDVTADITLLKFEPA